MARTQLSISSCNLYNLNEAGHHIYTNPTGWSQAEYDKKIAWTARILNEMKADVWGFQELWHAAALEKSFTQAGLGQDYTLLIPQGHAGQKIVCAGAVKKDILIGTWEWIDKFPANFKLESGGDDAQTSGISVKIDSFSRPVLHFEIKPRSDGDRIHVYVCHFKSKAPTKIYSEPWYTKNTYSRHAEALGGAISTIRRTAEAAAMRMLLTEQTKDTDTPVIVLGDFNDGQHSNTLNVLSGQPHYLLSGLSSGGSDTDLYMAGTLQQYRSLRDVYYTHIHENVRESLDHILVSQEFYDNSKKRKWAFKGMELMNDHLNDDEHKENGSSDHGIIRAHFEYRPA